MTPPSLRVRLFVALAAAGLLGALAAGLYAVAVDARSIGFVPRLLSVAPKALVLAAALLAVAAAAAALAVRRLARSVERLFAVFVRDAWHDLKTPLAAIRASVELLEDGALDDPPAARRFVGNVSRAAADLDRMLGDLVTLARMQTAGLAEERHTAVDAIVAEAIDRVAPLAAASDVLVATDLGEGDGPSRRLRCDPAALSRALGNLLENAVQASPGGRVHVSLAGADDGGVSLDLVNEPASVPPSVRRALFERAVTGRGRAGSGLGLAIARAAIEAHGGRVRFVEMGPPRVRVRVDLPR